MKLYLLTKVKAIEKTEEFKAALGSPSKRRKSALQANAIKKEMLSSYMDSLEIKIPMLTKEELYKAAIEQYNDHALSKSFIYDGNYDYDAATLQSDSSFLNRISLNYLRHCLTNYEEELKRIFGKVGKTEAYVKLKEKINNVIIDNYPYLAVTKDDKDINNK